MVKYLEPKYLVALVVASVVAIVFLQATGVGPALQASPPLERYEAAITREAHGRVPEPIAGQPSRWDEQSRWR
jgi:hypothetical protein